MMQRWGLFLSFFLSLTSPLCSLSLAPPLWQDPIQAISVLSVLRESPSKLDVIPRHEVSSQPINYAGQVHYSAP